MKILFIIHSLKYGGTERQLVELIKGLDHQSYDVRLVCLEKVSDGYIEQIKNEGI